MGTLTVAGGGGDARGTTAALEWWQGSAAVKGFGAVCVGV